jgi:type VI secretion system protein ImpA
MPSPDVLDFESLLAPIPGDSPAGADLRGDPSPVSAYQKIKGARGAARAAERQLVMGGDESDDNAPDWRPVLEGGVKVLAGKSKDLEVTAYLIEALVRLHGFAGLRDGFRLAYELVERFWDGLYPMPDEDGVETRVAALVGLNGDEADGTLIIPIARAPITAETSVGRFTAAQYQQAQALDRVTDAKQREWRIESGVPTLETLRKAVAETPGSFFVDLVQDLTLASETFAKVCAAVEGRGQGYSIPSSKIQAALEAVLDAVKDLARDKLQAAQSLLAALAAQAPQAPGEHGPAATAGVAGPDGHAAMADVIALVVRSREDAFHQLLRLADFFRRTEPHSIISYALEQIVSWGQMPLPQLFNNLITDDDERNKFFKHFGIKPPESS